MDVLHDELEALDDFIDTDHHAILLEYLFLIPSIDSAFKEGDHTELNKLLSESNEVLNRLRPNVSPQIQKAFDEIVSKNKKIQSLIKKDATSDEILKVFEEEADIATDLLSSLHM